MTLSSSPQNPQAKHPAAPKPPTIIWRHLGDEILYQPCWHRMRSWVANHNEEACDEIWSLQHQPVYTLGLAGDPTHLRRTTSIPCQKSDRGGQITYHGPGQLVVYFLLSLKRYHLNIRTLVDGIEEQIIRLLALYDIQAQNDPKRRGVYVAERKIASIGLKVSRGVCYHGLALNVMGDLKPFEAIDPCGYTDLHMTSMAQETNHILSMSTITQQMQTLVANWLTTTIHDTGFDENFHV